MGEGIYLLEQNSPANHINLPMLIIDFFGKYELVLVVEGVYEGEFTYSDLPEEIDTFGYAFVENGSIPIKLVFRFF